MTKIEKALQQLRRDLYDEIMKNTEDGDECSQCRAYRHSAMIVMGEAAAEPPIPNKEN